MNAVKLFLRESGAIWECSKKFTTDLPNGEGDETGATGSLIARVCKVTMSVRLGLLSVSVPVLSTAIAEDFQLHLRGTPVCGYRVQFNWGFPSFGHGKNLFY